MIEIDGQHAGGQLLRTALSLSAATGKAFEITKIRGQRQERGLKPQHLTAVHAMQKLCNADLQGDNIGSNDLVFKPNEIKGGSFTFDIGTAGSTILILQTLIPACLREEKSSTFTIKGGTDTLWCPGSMYFQNVFCNFMEKIGINIDFHVEKYGFYPKGNGIVACTVKPCVQLNNINFAERGSLKSMNANVIVSNDLQKRNVLERIMKGFKENFNEPIDINSQYVDTHSTGGFIHANVRYENYNVGADVIGERTKRAEDIGKECAEKIKLLTQSDGVDKYAADQLMVYMGLKRSGSVKSVEITDHIKTNAQVIEKFLPVKFTIKSQLIRCEPR